jgi:pilus assembly protein Flp/PilA
MRKLLTFLCGEEGATAVEYALMIALIAGVVIGGASLVGTNSNAKLDSFATTLSSAS